jgi:hypothetical protein
MWFDIGEKGYINENCVEYVEIISDNEFPIICLHIISGKKIKIQGLLASNIIVHTRNNRIQFVTKVSQPLGLNGDMT